MSATWIEPPPQPPQSGMGCFGKGCLILVVFCIVLGLAFIGGTFYAVRYLRTTYFPTAPVTLPANPTTKEEQQLALANWNIFERKARAHLPARIEMTAQELNALIAAEPELRGKALFSIDEDDLAHLQVSIPLADVSWLRGHYVNAECNIRSAADGNPANARFTRVIVNGEAVPEETLQWRYPWSLRGFISRWTEHNDLKVFLIRDGKIILETQGSG
jgi:hypothetical protein